MDLKKIFFLLTIIFSVQSSSGSGAAYVVKVAPKTLLTVPSPRRSNSPHFGPQKPTIKSASAPAEFVVPMNNSSLQPPAGSAHYQPNPTSPQTTEITPQSIYRSLTPKNLAPLSPHSAIHALAPHPSPAPSDAGSIGDVGGSPRSVAHSISKSHAESEKEATEIRLQCARVLTANNDKIRLQNSLKEMLHNRINLGSMQSNWQQFNNQKVHNERVTFSAFALNQMKARATKLIQQYSWQCVMDESLDAFIQGLIAGFNADQAVKAQQQADKKKAQEKSGCGCW